MNVHNRYGYYGQQYGHGHGGYHGIGVKRDILSVYICEFITIGLFGRNIDIGIFSGPHGLHVENRYRWIPWRTPASPPIIINSYI